MTLAVSVAIWILSANVTEARPDCVVVDGESVLARDIVSAVPEAAALAPETVLMLSPKPGVRRYIRARQLEQALRAAGGDGDVTSDVCIEGASRVLTKDEIVESIHRVMKIPTDSIEIFDYSRYAVPAGTVEFPLAGKPAGSPPSGRFTWRGQVRYGKDRTAPVWATVRVLATHRGVVSKSALLPGVAIEEGDLELKDLPGWRDAEEAEMSPRSFIGRTPKRRIKPGTELRADWLVDRKDVLRGDRVEVLVQSGLVALRLDGIAEGGGSTGEHIWVTPAGREWQVRRLRAIVWGPKKVTVEATNENSTGGPLLEHRNNGSRVR